MLSQHQQPASFPNYPQSYQSELPANRKRKSSETSTSAGTGKPARRRITRACDQCNQLRTKCDGKQPCAHCVEIRISCEYARAYKKRGRIPKEELQNGNEGSTTQEQQESTRERRSTISKRPSYSETESSPDNEDTKMPVQPNLDTTHTQFTNHTGDDQLNRIGQYSQNGNAVNVSNISDFLNPVPSNAFYSNNGFPPMEPQQMHDGPTVMQGAAQSLSNMDLGSFPQEFGFPLGDDYSVAFMGKAPMVESPDWLSFAPPSFMTMGVPPMPITNNFEEPLRYPVLQPLLPHITAILPVQLACDLLEQYFASTTSAYLRPSNPYIIGYVFRKKSFLHPTNPRRCSPALLSSMLWISAQISDAAFLNTQPDSRSRICQRLLELTIGLLKPLVHNAASLSTSDHVSKLSSDDASLGALVGMQTNPDNTQIDNIATYVHLATVVSASERKAASLRWWNAAWSLAREVRLGRELPPNSTEGDRDSDRDSPEQQHTSNSRHRNTSVSQPVKQFVPEEEREERRRVWWLLYMMDRHLALCYNRPMFFLNKECEALFQPMNDTDWQAGSFDSANLSNRRRGLNVECVSHSVFGYFLPLMVILGEILDLNHARSRPRFGPGIKRVKNFDSETRDIVELLEAYEQSLQDFTKSGMQILDQSQSTNHTTDAVTPSVMSSTTNDSYLQPTSTTTTAEAAHQTQTVIAYGTHIMHVLHILLTGKWDPIALLDDNDLWISSQSFVTATGHAVNAADAVGNIIEYDPDLSFQPFFIGVYLLQGSFLLLLFADKLQGTVSPEVVRACETIVRAHEACVATLDTQYQVSYNLNYCLSPSLLLPN